MRNGSMHGVVADERFRGNMHGLAKDAVVLSLDRAGTQARQSMLHASLAPPSGKAEGSADKRIIMLR